MNMLTQGLMASGNEVQVLAVSTPKHFIKDEEVDSQYRNKTSFRSVFIDTSVKPLNAVLNLFSNKSYNIIRFYSKDFESVLLNIISEQKFDVVILEALWVTVYLDAIRKHSNAKVLYRAHNSEFQIWERLAVDCRNPLKRSYLTLLAKRLKNYEVEMLNKYDGIAAITEADAAGFKALGCHIPIVHIPFGIDLQNYKPDNSDIEHPSLFHLGSMDWQPNADGISWFLKNAWPQITSKHPNLKLYLGGRGMPQWLQHLFVKNVMIKGEVANAREFINSKSIMIVPLHSGSGMRVKIVEGMALGKTIISTTVGAEGINYENEKNILIADTAEEFGRAVTKCIGDKAFCESIGANARILVEKKYDNNMITANLSEFLRTLLP